MKLGAMVNLERARDFGFKAAMMEINEETTEHDAIILGEDFANAGVTNAQIPCYRNLISTDEAIRQRNIEDVRQALRLAQLAGCRTVVVGGGHRNPQCPNEVFSPHPDNWTAQALDVLVDSCIQILSGNDLGDVRLAVETWVMTPISSAEAAVTLVKRVNNPNVGIVFDPVNCMNLDRYFTNGDFIRHFVDVVGDGIALVHLKDSLLKALPFTYHMSEVPIGEGNIDYSMLLKSIEPLNVPALVEHLPVDEYPASVDYVKKLATELGISIR